MTSAITLDSIIVEGMDQIISSDILVNELDMTAEIQEPHEHSANVSRINGRGSMGFNLDCFKNADISGIPCQPGEEFESDKMNVSAKMMILKDIKRSSKFSNSLSDYSVLKNSNCLKRNSGDLGSPNEENVIEVSKNEPLKENEHQMVIDRKKSLDLSSVSPRQQSPNIMNPSLEASQNHGKIMPKNFKNIDLEVPSGRELRKIDGAYQKYARQYDQFKGIPIQIKQQNWLVDSSQNHSKLVQEIEKKTTQKKAGITGKKMKREGFKKKQIKEGNDIKKRVKVNQKENKKKNFGRKKQRANTKKQRLHGSLDMKRDLYSPKYGRPTKKEFKLVKDPFEDLHYRYQGKIKLRRSGIVKHYKC